MYFLCYFIFLYLHSEILGVFVFEFSSISFQDTLFSVRSNKIHCMA